MKPLRKADFMAGDDSSGPEEARAAAHSQEGGSGAHDSAAALARSVLILANPASGGYRPRLLQDIAARLEARGCTVTIRLTRRAGEIGEICADPALRTGILAVAGGDGSVNEAIRGFQQNTAAATPELAVIPCGTANVLAAELKLPRSAEGIARMMLQRRSVPLHYGLANGRPFVLMASAGFDAEVVHAVPLALKRRLGKLAYVLTALDIAFSRHGEDLLVRIGDEAENGAEAGRTLTCRLAVVTKARHYGGPFVICPDGGVTRPGLHLLALEKDTPLAALRFGLALLTGRLHKTKGVTLVPVNSLTLTSRRAVPAQIDGDPFGVTPLTLTDGNRPLALLVG
ncbi:diacylglycerol/lipid kinase family protein [Pannonibacter phragmitetus]|uniref:diacylglycerol/lipid kinase family protein n=1 Tax=Pannonibacter phragmitetus TaxID=121719 RepID=UPI000F03105E|nr:diacylglycerol kinase family protein [Pannonibacter phragmitetus]